MFASKDALFAKSSGSYQISRSLRFRSSASAYLSRTASTPTSQNTWTLSWWMKIGKLGTSGDIFSAGTTSRLEITYSSTGSLNISDASTTFINTNNLLRDPSAWYHCVVKANGTGAALQVYVNGVLTSNSLTNNLTTSYWNASGVVHYIGALGGYSSTYFDGYLAEVNFIDGSALLPTAFGAFDTNGVWQPARYTGSYGTNGFYLNFSDNSGATATTIGKDSSGNSNNWTPTNIVVTSGTTCDSMLDVPTNYSDGTVYGRGNYCVLNPVYTGGASLTNGNLYAQATTAAYTKAIGTLAFPTSGKYYFEVTLVSNNGSGNNQMAGIFSITSSGTYAILDCFATSSTSIRKSIDGVASGSYGTAGNGVVLGFAVDADNGKAYLAVSNTWIDSSSPTGGTGGYSMAANNVYVPYFQGYSSGYSAFNFGQQPFTYTPPSGFSALNTQNLPSPVIANGAQYMAAVTYQGATAPNTVTATTTNSGNNPLATTFQPDLVWIKAVSSSTNNKLTDAVRGTTKALISNTTGAETTDTNGLTAFTTSGFTVGSDTTYNNTTGPVSYVAWEWNAGGSNATNTTGSITSTVRANTSAGFSIITYTGNGTAGATVGHGLGVAPSMFIVKERSGTNAATASWYVYHVSLGNNYRLYLDLTNASSTSANVCYPSGSTTIYMNTNDYFFNELGGNYICYAWASIAGYSSFGSFVGNNLADGPYVYTGFRPRWVLMKNTTTAATQWFLYDSSTSTYNVVGYEFAPNATTFTPASYSRLDFLSNGFKIRASGIDSNISGNTMIYAAFAENPFKYSRAR